MYIISLYKGTNIRSIRNNGEIDEVIIEKLGKINKYKEGKN